MKNYNNDMNVICINININTKKKKRKLKFTNNKYSDFGLIANMCFLTTINI